TTASAPVSTGADAVRAGGRGTAGAESEGIVMDPRICGQGSKRGNAASRRPTGVTPSRRLRRRSARVGSTWQGRHGYSAEEGAPSQSGGSSARLHRRVGRESEPRYRPV